jgi:hypothetical protein
MRSKTVEFIDKLSRNLTEEDFEKKGKGTVWCINYVSAV